MDLPFSQRRPVAVCIADVRKVVQHDGNQQTLLRTVGGSGSVMFRGRSRVLVPTTVEQ